MTAAGSYLQARTAGGEWRLRIEDLDTPRVIPGTADDILKTLECFGFEWDGPILWQSTHTSAYEEALQRLEAKGLVIPSDEPDGLLRFRAADREVSFQDGLQGLYTQNVATAVGDFVIRRRCGLFAYQLAVVVDDAFQDITEVVRGCDLLDNTPRQMLLQQALELPSPAYLHLPLLTEPGGEKLAKSRRSLPLKSVAPSPQLWSALQMLRQPVPVALKDSGTAELWKWALSHWDPFPLNKIRAIELPQP